MYFYIKILYDVNNPHGFLAELTLQLLPQAADFPPIFVWHACIEKMYILPMIKLCYIF